MNEIARSKKWLWIAIVGWSLLVCASFAFNSWQSWQSMLEQGRSEGKMAFLKDLSYRAWNASHGGVYVPVTKSTKPNPYLHVPHRDVTTTDGQKLTLINPAYMTRQVFTMSAECYGIKGHITSLNLLNPGNTPDPWEKKALQAFEKNPAEITESLLINGKPFMRFMRPLITENSCLKRHAKQGYKLGDIRGGISESVPMSNLISKAKKTIWYLAFAHGAFLIIGILGLIWGHRTITQYFIAGLESGEKAKAEKLMLQQERDMFVVGSVVVFKWPNLENWSVEYVSANVKELLGYTVEEFLQGKVIYANIVHPKDIRRVVDEVKSYSHNHVERFNHQPYRLVSQNGDVVWVLHYTSILRDEAGVITHYLGYLVDITERKELEDSLKKREEQLRTLINSTPDIICFKDGQGRWLEANEADLKIFQLENVDYRGKKDSELAKYGEFYYDAFMTCEESDEIAWQKGTQSRGIEIIPKPDGSKKVYDIIKVPLFESDGARKGLVVLGRDITELKQAEEKLEEKERFLKTIFDGIQEPMHVIDRDYKVLLTNKLLLEIKDVKQEDIRGKYCYEVYQGRNEYCEQCGAKEVFKTGKPYSLIKSLPLPDGTYGYFELYSFPLFEKNGEIAQVIEMAHNITGRKHAEEKLKKNEKKYRELSTLLRLMADNIPDMLWAKNLNKEFIFVNKAMCRNLLNAKDTDEPLGKTDMFFATRECNAHPDNPQWHTFGEICRDTDTATLEVMKPMHFDEFGNVKGKFLFLDVHKAPLYDSDGQLIGVVGSARDVTAAKETEKQLRKLSTAVTQSPSVIAITDTNGNLEYVNPKFTEITGYSWEEVIGQNPRILRSGEYPSYMYKELWETISSGNTWRGEMHNKKKNGELYWEMASISPIFDEQGKIINYVKVAEDITQRKHAEEQLHNEREKLFVTLQSIGDGVITTDTEGRVVFINNVAEELTGWNQEEAAGQPLQEVFNIINEKTGEPVENPVKKVLDSGTIIGLTNHTALIARDGTRRSIADSAAPILDSQGKTIGVVLVFRDVTEKKKREEEQFKLKKLESVGVLAGGIAHDFNNILTAILGNISLAGIYIDKNNKAHRLLQDAEKASFRAKDLTQQLLTFSKGGDPVRETASITQVITDSADFVLHGSNVACRYAFPEDLWLVHIDTGQMSQVIQNLVINARHAMPEGGEINISCENIADIRKETDLSLPKEKYIKITIADTGGGIPEKYLDKIFDPYFSTKQQGSGLGLAITHSIINKHDGHITVGSKSGDGTTFTIYLPAAAEQKSRDAGEEAQQRGKTAKGTILVMDDDEMIRDLAKEILSRFGHEVLQAKDGEEAIAIFKEHHHSDNPVDVIIMDLTIPGGMGGQEAIQGILKIDSDAKAIVSSGYANDPVVANYHQYGFKAALGKPFKMAQLKEIINSILMTS